MIYGAVLMTAIGNNYVLIEGQGTCRTENAKRKIAITPMNLA